MRKPSPALVVACAALFVALGGPATAAKLISGKKIKPNSITTRQIRNRTLTSADIAKSTVASLKAGAREVTSDDIVDGSVELADMATNSVTGNQVVDRSLAAVDITADSITGGELATGAIGADELLPDSVLNAKLKDSVVTKTKVASDAIAASEVRDGSLTAKDVGKSAGVVNGSFSVPAGTCSAQDLPTPSDVSGTVVVIAAPGDGAIVSARPASATALHVQVCAPGNAAASVSGDFPYVAFAS
jgi:hypothetical protein